MNRTCRKFGMCMWMSWAIVGVGEVGEGQKRGYIWNAHVHDKMHVWTIHHHTHIVHRTSFVVHHIFHLRVDGHCPSICMTIHVPTAATVLASEYFHDGVDCWDEDSPLDVNVDVGVWVDDWFDVWLDVSVADVDAAVDVLVRHRMGWYGNENEDAFGSSKHGTRTRIRVWVATRVRGTRRERRNIVTRNYYDDHELINDHACTCVCVCALCVCFVCARRMWCDMMWCDSVDPHNRNIERGNGILEAIGTNRTTEHAVHPPKKKPEIMIQFACIPQHSYRKKCAIKIRIEDSALCRTLSDHALAVSLIGLFVNLQVSLECRTSWKMHAQVVVSRCSCVINVCVFFEAPLSCPCCVCFEC